MNLQEGATLRGGKYRIVKELGSGTFGITYLATMKVEVQGPLGKMEVPASVCIKEFFISKRNSRGSDSHSVIGTDGEDWEEYRKRFRKEAENLTKLDHPNIVKVLDVFDENNTTYFVMQYVEGENLNNYLKRSHPLNESEAVDIIKAVGEALQYMHDRRILHLDLKPGNIMRSKDGKIYLIDFGLSKQFTDDGNQATSLEFGKGTKGYAPIEQDAEELKEGEFAPTLDVYALGAVLFKLLTGNTPPLALVVLRDGLSTVQLKEFNRSQYLIDVITKAMAPMKRDRCQSVGEFLKYLETGDELGVNIVSVETTELDFQTTNTPSQEIINDIVEKARTLYQICKYSEAYQLFLKAAGFDDIYSQCALGIMYQEGRGIDKDYFEALKWYKKAAEKGHPFAQLSLGRMYKYGWGVTLNNEEAFGWFKKAANQGQKAAEYELGRMYSSGTGVKKDLSEGFKWYQKAAEKGVAEAQTRLGAMYYNGLVVKQNYVDALKWFRFAAEQGNANGQLNLGVMYNNGDGIEKDVEEAVRWYRKAAGQGDSTAQCYLGHCYEYGKGVYQNYSEAIEWYKKAAEQNDTDALFHLGDLFFSGIGAVKDESKAKEYYKKAADLGNEDAKLMVEYLNS